MKPNLVLYPVIAMVALTFLVTAHLYFVQKRAIKKWDVKYGFFKIYEGDRPDYLQAARDHYKNMFQLPILFYSWAGIIFMMGNVDTLDLSLAWLFVASRYLHSGIRIIDHTKLLRRSSVFIVGWFVLLIAWGKLLFDLLFYYS
ncbi:MAG: MAPEG family protein [Candidatus Marinimicrobia bacterium]|nr:MAPEG family protein [Candidatus Neomarinimicrobiota bacterium]MDP7528437.1 MAPEG family protein [Candidatus Neomarinimicrobiota bacterium]